MDDPENLESKYFVDYFGNIVRLGEVGAYRSYQPDDYIGMSKSCAMDIAEEQIHSIIIEETNFNNWFNTRYKFCTLYTSINIYLYDPYYNNETLVKDWFRELYIMKRYK